MKCFRFIRAERANHRISLLCRVLAVSRSGYYAWERRPEPPRRRDDRRLARAIGRIHARRRRTYGSPRVHAQLRREGIRVSRKRVERLMGDAGLRGAGRRRRRGTTVRLRGVRPAPDLVDRRFRARGPNQLWFADIREIATGEGKLYLAAVIDCYSRAVVGWAMAQRMEAELVVGALEMATVRRRPARGLIHHSDQGAQRGLNPSSQQCVREMNLGTAGDDCTGFAAGTRLGWRGCRRGGSPGGRAGAAIAACTPSGARHGRGRLHRVRPGGLGFSQ